MKEKYVIYECGFVREDGAIISRKMVSEHDDEAKAVNALAELDVDNHFVERHVWKHIGIGIYDWEADENYGSSTFSGGKFIWDYE